jgi:hypothetical protein
MSEVIDKLDASRLRLKNLGATGMSLFLSPDAKDVLVFTLQAEKFMIREKRWNVVEKYVPFVKSIRKKNRDMRRKKMFGCSDSFAETSVEDMNKAGKEAGEALNKI